MANSRAAAVAVGAVQSAVPDVSRTAEVNRSEPIRIAPLDGLRGVAILLVLLHNSGTVSGALSSIGLKLWAALVAPGWVGVQLFFALSGFLITRILLESKGADGYVRRFYMRRILRIFPLYYAALAIVFFVAPHVRGLEALAERYPRSALWYWSYLANWALPFGSLAPSLGHFWSLAVEEQFYIVWPAVVLVLRERSLAALCISMVLAALVVRVALFRIYEPITASSAAYNFTIARCDALAMGALVAVLARHPRAMAIALRWTYRVAVASALAIAAILVMQRGFHPLEFPIVTVGQTVLAMLSGALVLLCLSPSASAATVRWQRAMSVSWLRSVGKYSYAMYVVHLPLSRVLRPRVEGALASGGSMMRLGEHVAYAFVIIVLSYALALVSWHLIEQPFLNLRRFFTVPAEREAPALA
jgi:peptidoglycan/LPS O-acetylase OafA/YrhL